MSIGRAAPLALAALLLAPTVAGAAYGDPSPRVGDRSVGVDPARAAPDPARLLIEVLARAKTLSQQGKLQEALASLDKFLLNRIEHADLDVLPIILNKKGVILFDAGEKERAREVFRLILTQRPGDPFARLMLGRLKDKTKPPVREMERPSAPKRAEAPPKREEPKPVRRKRGAGPFANAKKRVSIPEDNPRVQSQLQWFTRTKRGRRILQSWIRRGGPFIPIVRYIFREAGVPEELSLLMLAESGGNPNAQSGAGAVGSFQFMRGTARDMKLRVGSGLVDERRSPEKAALAAALYLKVMVERYRFTWPLSLAAYNCGPGCVRNRIRREGTRDYFSLKSLPKESMIYVPRIFAVILIFRDLKRYNFRYDPEAARYDVREVEGPLSLAEIARRERTTTARLRRLNTELLSDKIPPGPYLLKVPARKGWRAE
ncbi:MAG: transglycosylase SLT domain-containing protein [bacterium]